MSDRYAAVEAQSTFTRAVVRALRDDQPLAPSVVAPLFEDDPQAVAEGLRYNCGGYGCGHQPCICDQGAAEPASMEPTPGQIIATLRAENADLRRRCGIQANSITALMAGADPQGKVASLEKEINRYVDWNSALGAANERLRDENADLKRQASLTPATAAATNPLLRAIGRAANGRP